MSIRDYLKIVEARNKTRFSWTTKLRFARAFETEADASAYIADVLKRPECSPCDTRDGWVIYDGLGKRMLSDNSMIETAAPSKFKRRKPMPTRSGNTPAAYRAHIIAVMHWKQEKAGTLEWSGTVGEALSNTGIKVAQAMEQEGIVRLSLSIHHAHVDRGGPHVGTPRHVNIESFQQFKLTPGPNFPRQVSEEGAGSRAGLNAIEKSMR